MEIVSLIQTLLLKTALMKHYNRRQNIWEKL